jgi:hypothetical protein
VINTARIETLSLLWNSGSLLSCAKTTQDHKRHETLYESGRVFSLARERKGIMPSQGCEGRGKEWGEHPEGLALIRHDTLKRTAGEKNG